MMTTKSRPESTDAAWVRVAASLPPLDRSPDAPDEPAPRAALRALVAERDEQLYVLELLAEGRAELAELWVRAGSSKFAGLVRGIVDLVGNFTDSPYHECCDCSMDEDPDWGDCPGCADRAGSHCVVCERSPGLADRVLEWAGAEGVPPEVVEGLRAVASDLGVGEDCEGVD